jgi:uncharacterized protein YcfL
MFKYIFVAVVLFLLNGCATNTNSLANDLVRIVK